MDGRMEEEESGFVRRWQRNCTLESAHAAGLSVARASERASAAFNAVSECHHTDVVAHLPSPLPPLSLPHSDWETIASIISPQECATSEKGIRCGVTSLVVPKY